MEWDGAHKYRNITTKYGVEHTQFSFSVLFFFTEAIAMYGNSWSSK
jgi:hypothetical protein